MRRCAGCLEQDGDVAPRDVVLDHLEEPHTGGAVNGQIAVDVRVLGGGVEVRHALDAGVSKRPVARERIVAGRLPAGHGGAVDARQLLEVVGYLRHSLGEDSQHVVRSAARASLLEVGECLVRIVGHADVAPGAHGDAPGIGHLFDEQDTASGIMRLDRRNRPGIAVADDHHVVGVVPGFGERAPATRLFHVGSWRLLAVAGVCRRLRRCFGAS